ncbi:MAG: SpoIIE family protein phosphatase [Melioribacteraceae bacterium]|nr:SpoIIE family protein phosphatase [Melioribacteraceae bacterium]
MKLSGNNTALRNFSALVDFSNLINSSLDLDFALNNLMLTCFGKFHTTKGIVCLVDENGLLQHKISKGYLGEIAEKIPAINASEIDTCEVLKKFKEENNIPICKKLISTSGIVGVIFLGEKITKLPYEKEDHEFLTTIINIASSAIENSQIVAKLKTANRNLDGKVNQLSSLFDLSKEFSGILEENMISKMVVFSVIGQMMVSKYAVLTCYDDEISILDSKINNDDLTKALSGCGLKNISSTLTKTEIEKNNKEIFDLGIELIIPMQIKGENKGLILLGKRISGAEYSNSDIEYISSVGSLAIISIENAKLFKERLEKEKIEKDLELAKNIQKNLLPKKFPKLNSFEISAFNETARQVGGDYYDVVKLDKNRTLFAIGDVSGKGVQAALIMANVQAFLKSICKQNLPLDKSTDLINDLVSENTSGGGFITFFWGILNDETKELTYVNAGHNPPLLIRHGEITKLKKGGMILGVMETLVPYEAEIIQLEKDDVIVLFTDGITEAMDTEMVEFSDERLEEISLKYASLPAYELTSKIMEDVKVFTSGAEQSDDITSLIVKVK